MYGARPGAQAAGPNEGYERAKSICERLSKGPWQCHMQQPWADELLAEICRITMPRSAIQDTGVASVLRTGLVQAEWLTAHPTDERDVLEFRKAATPPAPDTRTWDQIENAHLDELRKQEQ